MSNIFHFPKYSIVTGGVKLNVDLKRFEKQFEDAQYWLDTQIMNSMVPYMPMRDGNLIKLTRARSASVAGTGKVYAAYGTPYGRFQYMGKVMVDEKTGSAWARKDARKVLTSKNLRYSKAGATAKWFDTAKRQDGEAWIKGVKKRAGGENN